jgi:hypothetical protein
LTSDHRRAYLGIVVPAENPAVTALAETMEADRDPRWATVARLANVAYWLPFKGLVMWMVGPDWRLPKERCPWTRPGLPPHRRRVALGLGRPVRKRNERSRIAMKQWARHNARGDGGGTGPVRWYHRVVFLDVALLGATAFVVLWSDPSVTPRITIGGPEL